MWDESAQVDYLQLGTSPFQLAAPRAFGAEERSCLRLVDLVSRLFGLASLDDSLRVSDAFAVPVTDLVAAADTRGVRARATALRVLAADLSLDDLLALGALMGCWGQPLRWHMARQVLVPLPLCRGPPTNSGRGGEPPGR